MNRKRNVSFIKPEDPNFLKVLKKQVGYDDTNHKFDKLDNSDFVEDDLSEQPQVVVLKKGDLTAEEAEIEKAKIEKLESETKADLSQRVLFKAKSKQSASAKSSKQKSGTKSSNKKQLLSFDQDCDEDS